MQPTRSEPSSETPEDCPRFAFVVNALGDIHRRVMGVRAFRPAMAFGLQDGTEPGHVLNVCELALDDVVRGLVVGVPMLPGDLLADQERAVDCMAAAVARAGRVDAIGLGSLCAVVAGRGEGLAERCGVPVTNGGAATAWAVLGNVRAVLDRVGRDRPVAVIGARGPVGGVVAEILAAEGVAVRVDHPRAARGRDVEAAKDPAGAVTGCRVIVGAGPTGSVLAADAVADDAVVVDVALPGTLIGRPSGGVQVLAGEAVTLPTGWSRGGWGWLYHLLAGYGPYQVFACLVEPLVIAVTGRTEPFSIGRHLSAEAVRAFGQAAEGLGFAPRLARGWFAFDPQRIRQQIPDGSTSG